MSFWRGLNEIDGWLKDENQSRAHDGPGFDAALGRCVLEAGRFSGVVHGEVAGAF